MPNLWIGWWYIGYIITGLIVAIVIAYNMDGKDHNHDYPSYTGDRAVIGMISFSYGAVWPAIVTFWVIGQMGRLARKVTNG